MREGASEDSPPSAGVRLVHGLEDRPPPLVTLVAATQHLLGVFVSVATVPLIISLGMGLSPEDAAYMVGASLVVSGVATMIQVTRPGPLGSGLLSVQGTSFAFVGPFIYIATLDPGGGASPSPSGSVRCSARRRSAPCW